jgi:hypothetical protein
MNVQERHEQEEQQEEKSLTQDIRVTESLLRKNKKISMISTRFDHRKEGEATLFVLRENW